MLQNIYSQKITILNKLKRTDSATGLDVWYKSVIEDAAWYKQVERSVTNSSVYIGTFTKILIPFHNEFLPYEEWKKAGNPDTHFTISTGDYIVLGEVSEPITSNNIIKLMQDYGENVCLVKHHRICPERFGAKIQLQIEGI